MKITLNGLRRIIKEEVRRMSEALGASVSEEELMGHYDDLRAEYGDSVPAQELADALGVTVDELGEIGAFRDTFGVRLDRNTNDPVVFLRW